MAIEDVQALYKQGLDWLTKCGASITEIARERKPYRWNGHIGGYMRSLEIEQPDLTEPQYQEYKRTGRLPVDGLGSQAVSAEPLELPSTHRAEPLKAPKQAGKPLEAPRQGGKPLTAPKPVRMPEPLTPRPVDRARLRQALRAADTPQPQHKVAMAQRTQSAAGEQARRNQMIKSAWHNWNMAHSPQYRYEQERVQALKLMADAGISKHKAYAFASQGILTVKSAQAFIDRQWPRRR